MGSVNKVLTAGDKQTEDESPGAWTWKQAQLQDDSTICLVVHP